MRNYFFLKHKTKTVQYFNLNIDKTLRKMIATSILKNFNVENKGYDFKDIISNSNIKLQHDNPNYPLVYIDIKRNELSLSYPVTFKKIKTNLNLNILSSSFNAFKLIKYKFLSLFFIRRVLKRIKYNHISTYEIEPMAIINNKYEDCSGFVSSVFKVDKTLNFEDICFDIFLSAVFLGYNENDSKINRIENKKELIEVIPELKNVDFIFLLQNEQRFDQFIESLKGYSNFIEIRDSKITKDSIEILKINYQF